MLACPILGLALAAVASAPPPNLWRVHVFRDWFTVVDGKVAPGATALAACIEPGGFVVVDSEVVEGAADLFIGYPDRGPFAARLRAVDEGTGLALLSVNPEVLDGRSCLRIPDVAGSAAQEAAPMLAGMPVFDRQGAWVGIGAAGPSKEKLGKDAVGEWTGQESRRRAQSVEPPDVVRRLVARAASVEGARTPPSTPVTVGSARVFPRELRRPSAPTADELACYEAYSEDGARLELLTPASLDTLDRLDDPVYHGERDFFRWHDHRAMWEPGVIVQLAPDFHWTAGSKAAAVVTTILFIPSVLGGAPIGFRAALTTGKEERSFRVDRGGVPIDPVESFVVCFEDNLVVKRPDHEKPEERRVKGCRPFALFDPDAFAPGAKVEVVAKDPAGKSHRVPIDPATQVRLAADFEPWRAATREGAPPAPAAPPFTLVLPGEAVMIPVDGGSTLRLTFVDGSRYDVTRFERDGEPAIRFPVWRRHVAFKARSTHPAGWLEVTPEAIVFEPLDETIRATGTVRIPRHGATVERGAWGVLHVRTEEATWTFVPRFENDPPAVTFVRWGPNQAPATRLILRSLPPEKPIVEAP